MALHYIEHEGALYRGPARAWPEEVWDMRERKWCPYEGKVPKGVEWGEIISDQDAARMMAEKHPYARD